MAAASPSTVCSKFLAPANADQVAIQDVLKLFDVAGCLEDASHRLRLLGQRVLHARQALGMLELGLGNLLPLPAALLGDGFLVGGKSLGVMLQAFVQGAGQSSRRPHRPFPSIALAAASIEACQSWACRSISRSVAATMTSAMRRMATTWPSAPAGAAGRYSASSLSTWRSTAVSNAVSAPIDEEVHEHQDHRERKGHRRRVELQAQAHDDLQHRLVERLGIDGVQGQRDADDGAQKAEDGDRPHDQAKQAIAAVGQRGIAVGKILQFIAEAFGRTETQDVIHRRAEPAQIIFILPIGRLAFQLRMQRPAKFIQRQLAGVDGFPGRLAQRPIAG